MTSAAPQRVSRRWDSAAMDLGYVGKVAVVSGGVSGIGAALIAALDAEGAHVALLDIAAEPATDVSDPDQVVEAIARVVDRHGRIDALFSNAGVLYAGDTESFPLDLFDRTLAVNLRGAFLLARSCIPHLRKSRGAMLFTASTSAILGAAGEAAYAASKAGITGLARSLAAELAADGIRVNALAPGWIDTPFNDPVWDHAGEREAAVANAMRSVPLRRQAEPSEVAGTMLHLCAPTTTYITGQVIAIDGGLSTLR